MGAREREDGEALGDVFLHPNGKFGSGFGVGGDEVMEAGLGGGEIRAVENGTDVGGDAGAHVKARDVSLGVLLEVELAALPRDRREDGGTGGVESAMSVADDEAETVETAGLERGEERTPMGLRLTQSSTETENRTFSIGTDPDSNEHGAIQELAALADLFVSGIEDHIWTGSQGTFSPGLELGIKFGRAVADLCGTDGMPAEFLDDFCDFAGGDALDIHLGQSEQESLFAASTLFQSTGIKVHAVADLGDAKLDGAEASDEGFGFKAVGAALSAFATLVRAGLKDGGAFLNHGLVDKQTEALGKARGAFRGEELQNVVQEISIDLVGHVCVVVGCVLVTPQQETTLARL